MDATIVINMLRTSLPGKGNSLSLDNQKILAVIADAFSRERELREVFVNMVNSLTCYRMYEHRKDKDFASFVQKEMECFMRKYPGTNDETIRTSFYIWAKAVCPRYQNMSHEIACLPLVNQQSTPIAKRKTPIKIVSKYIPPDSKPDSTVVWKNTRIILIILAVILALTLIVLLWMKFHIARIVICSCIAIFLVIRLMIFIDE